MDQRIKPILFNIEMIRAIRSGKKTMTRRVIRPQPEGAYTVISMDENERVAYFMCNYPNSSEHFEWSVAAKAPYWTNDILWVRETWTEFHGAYFYKADFRDCLEPLMDAQDAKWHPSIHMPRTAARIFLRVTDVRAERLQDITPEEVDAEGCKEWGYSAKTGELLPSSPVLFSVRWNQTIEKSDLPRYGWDANPWVWVIEFKSCDKPEGWCN